MATTTPRIGLTKPDGTDLVDIAVLNTNFDKIDSNIASTKIQSTKPTTANAGDLWWDSDTGTLYLYYVDANSSQWVAATSDPINIGVVANQTERDAQYPTPAQGMSVYRTDLGVTQRYYGLFNSSTNPGGRDTAGWYDTEKSVGLVPIQVPTVVVASGSGSSNALGVITVTGGTVIELRGCFSSKYKNYRLIVQGSHTASTESRLRVMSGTTPSTSFYSWSGYYAVPTTTGAFMGSSSDTQIEISWNNTSQGASIVDIINPYVSTFTSFIGTHSTNGGSSQQRNATHGANSSYDGLYLFESTGSFTGTIQLFGLNA